MLSRRATRGDENLAAGRRRSGGGGCCCLSAVADECLATLSECGATSVREPGCVEGQQLQVAEASCQEHKGGGGGGGGGTRPMVVVQVQGTVDSVSCLSLTRTQRSVFSSPQHRSYQVHSSSSPSSSSSTPSSPSSLSSCLQDAAPMVALECELPLSGRLSPPAELTRSMSAPFLTSVAAAGAADPGQHHSHGAADLVHNLALGAESSVHHHTGSSEHLSGSLAQPASPYPANGVSRSGTKRKLPRREDAICEEEDVELLEGQVVEHSCQTSVLGVTRSWCGEQCEDVSGRKKRRLLDREAEEGGMDLSSVNLGGEEGVTESVEESRHSVMVQQQVNCVVYDSLGTVSVSTIPSAAAETEVSLNVVVEDSPDSVVEVDVVGDDGEGTLSSKLPCPSVDVSPKDGPGDTEHGSSEEASSEDGEDDTFLMTPRPPRISPFLNTPKQRKEERRKILKMSIHKMRAVEDPEHFLRRSVLINNTMKRLQRELREEKMRNNPRRSCYGLYRRASSVHYDVLNNSYLIHDEPFAISENDRITDDMTDALVTKLEATSSPVVPTPSPSPCPAEEPDTSSMALPIVSSESSTWSSDVSSTVPDLSTHLTSPNCLPEPSLPSQGELMSSLSPSSSETVSTTSGPDMTSLSPSSISSPSSATSPSSCTMYEGVFNVPGLGRDTQSPTSSCSSQSQREKQLYADIDTVFNNLIHALGDS